MRLSLFYLLCYLCSSVSVCVCHSSVSVCVSPVSVCVCVTPISVCACFYQCKYLSLFQVKYKLGIEGGIVSYMCLSHFYKF